MKVAVLEGSRNLVIQDAPKPTLRRDEVLIKVKYCGICGSDLHTYVEGLSLGIGHEYSGDIVEVGVAVVGWSVGDRVAVAPKDPCMTCYWCRRGEIGLCAEMFKNATGSRSTAFSSYAKAKVSQLHELSDDMTYEQGTLIEPTSCALHAVNRSVIKIGDTVAVLGLGPIGYLVAELTKISGARAIYGTEISPSRIALGKNVADEVINPLEVDPTDRILERTNGMGTDLVFECSGSVEATQDALAIVRKGGTVVIPGMCFEAVEFSVIDVVLKELTLKGSLTYTIGEDAFAFDVIRNKRIDVEKIITAKVPLDNINDAFDMALNGEGLKILVVP